MTVKEYLTLFLVVLGSFVAIIGLSIDIGGLIETRRWDKKSMHKSFDIAGLMFFGYVVLVCLLTLITAPYL